MDRREAMLRELNLYPQWVRRNQPVAAEQNGQNAEQVEAAAPAVVVAPSPFAPPSAQPSVSSEAEESSRTEKDNIQAGLSVATPLSQVDRLGWTELKQMVRDCTACKLRAGCTQTVFGVGDENADWLFVGEGPGADEDAQGEPFVGQAGKLLDNMLMAIRLKRGNNVYIANIVKCRPPGNRNPEADEIAACLPYLQRQIELIQPKMIVALGKVASNALLGKDATLASLRGKLHDYRGIPLIVTYHPAYLLRSPTEKAKAWQDLCMAVRVRHGEA
jgi:uracil-DNA glycosylase family 4